MAKRWRKKQQHEGGGEPAMTALQWRHRGESNGKCQLQKSLKRPTQIAGYWFFGVFWGSLARIYFYIYIKIIISIMIIIIYNICIYVYIHTLHVRVYPLILYLVFFLWGVLCFLHGSLSPSYTRFWSDEFKSPAVWRETWAKVIVVALP